MTARLPLRLRVAMAFALTAALTLTALGAFVYYRVQATLEAQTRASLETQMDALARLPRSTRPGAAAQLSGDTFAQVLTPGAVVVASSPQVSGALITPDQVPVTGRTVHVDRQVRLVSEDELEGALLLVRQDDGQVLAVGSSREVLEEAQAGVLTQLLVGGPLALALASWLGYLVAGAALRPVERMRRHAATISARSSGERLPIPAARDELQRLGVTLNQMLDRLELTLQRERRFVAEASHELRTPLALLQTELHLALSRPRSHEELLAALESADEEVTRLTRLSENLLLLAGAEESRLVLDESTFDVEGLLRAVADRFAPAATARDRRVTVAGTYPIVVSADRDRLDQALSNLVDNALRHGAGDVHLEATRRHREVCILVSDHGDGPEPERRGFGLSIVYAVAIAHGGTVTVGDGAGTSGAGVTIHLPQPG